MKINTARFVISNTEVDKCPPPVLPEFAFIGRSNVGKSSLINMLTDQNKLAKISARPGKTQCINHFIINDKWYLVDLPGYGFARNSKSDREKFESFISEYILTRESLNCLFVLIDSRLKLQKIDEEFVTWLGNSQIPFALIFTKIDKLNKKQLTENIALYKEELLKTWDELPEILYSSSFAKQGREDILSFIENIL